MFFRDIDGDTFPVSMIASIERPYSNAENPEHHHFDELKVLLVNGETIRVNRGVVDKLAELPTSSFSAAPGTYLLSFFEGQLSYKPVLGWQTNGAGHVAPILLHGVFDDDYEDIVIQTPDGRVSDEHSNIWPSIDAYRDYMVEKEK